MTAPDQMDTFDRHGRSKARFTVVLVTGALLLIAGATVFFTSLQNDQIEGRHASAIRAEVRAAANAIQEFVTSRQRQIEAFSLDNEALLAAFADDVEDEALRATLEERLRRWFPEYFTFTLADERGNDLVDDIEGFVGAACQVNILHYVEKLRRSTGFHVGYTSIIHPQANNYHFDVMAPWRVGERLAGVFFVSFYPEALSAILRSYQGPDHHLTLVHRERDYLIEVDAVGGRDQIASSREINLTASEIAEIRATQDVDSSVWRVVGYAEPGLIDDLQWTNWRNAFFIIVFTSLAGGLSLWRILRLDRDQRTILGQLEQSNDSLVRLAAEQSKLREAAEAGERTKAQFLASISHEIRTPLNAVIGLSDLVLGTDLTDHQRSYLQRVSRAGRALLALINDLLDFSKIEAGKLTVERIEFDLDEVLEHVSTVVNPKVEENANEMIITVDRSIPPMLWGDPLRLGQILVNLAGNAAKFTQNGEIVVDVARERVGNADLIECSVRDTGIGMTQDQQERLFKPFTQADQSVTRNYGGTGLGLSISYELVKAMGGDLAVESAPGEGSRFFFRIPLEAVAGAAPRDAFEGIDPEATRILVIEDNQVMREELIQALSVLKIKVTAAESGDAAVERFREALAGIPFDVVMLDWNMPNGESLQTLERLRTVAQDRAFAPIAMVTASEGAGVLEVEQHGIGFAVNKPINTSHVVDTLMEYLNQHASRRSVRPLSLDPDDQAILQGQGRVLVVDDAELNRLVAVGVLEKAGFTVDVAENGQDAIDKLSDDEAPPFDAVLMDLEMPGVDGLTATRRIRGELGMADLPIIAMTAHAFEADRQRCIDAGMVDHVSKPFERVQLISTLRKWLAEPAETV